MLSGDASVAKYPEGGFPYVPGLDVCGEVVDAVPPFAVGDIIVATWGGAFGAGGLAEYTLVDASMAVRKPDGLSCVDASALANSAGHALNALKAASVKKGDRVLVLGGSGGVGTALLQLAKAPDFDVSFLAATSSDPSLLASLGVDRPINYIQEDWWALQEFKDRPFDVIIDCAEGVSAWKHVNIRQSVLKRGGRFLAVVLNEWDIKANRWWQLFGVLFPPLGRMLGSMVASLWGGSRYIMYLGGLDGKTMEDVMRFVRDGSLKTILDKSSPFPFSTDGVASAFDLLRSRRAKGKIVVQIAP